MNEKDLQVLLHMHATARGETTAKIQSLQSVLNWGAALLLGATSLVVVVIGQSRDSASWTQIVEWAFLVLVSAAVAFQYSGEMANIARAGAYAYRLESILEEHRVCPDVESFAHWTQVTHDWIIPAFILSA